VPVLSLRLQNLGPFDDIRFAFDERINVFVGPNNSGKTTVLSALGDILIYPFHLPRKFLRDKSRFELKYSAGHGPATALDGELPVGEQGLARQERLFKAVGYSYYVPALRMGTDFRSKGPGHPPGKQRPEFLKREHLFKNEESLLTDREIVQSLIELDYRAYREKKPGIRDIIGRIARIASEITEGFPIEFRGIGEDSEGLFPQFETPDGIMPLGALSQGTQSLIQWLAYFVVGYSQYYDYAGSLDDKPGVLIIDEVDAHLHPSWQRRILPTLTKHFPRLTIFCSTHSPLMLAGLRAGQVHLLRRNTQGKVTASRNTRDLIGWSADEVLRRLLDVPTPTDLRTEDDLRKLRELRRKESLSAGEQRQLDQLRYNVSQELLGSLADAEGNKVSAWLELSEKKPSRAKPTPRTIKSVRPARAALNRRTSSAQRKPPGARRKVTRPRGKR